MGHPARHRALSAVLVAIFALVATGCGGGNPLPKAQPPSPSAAPVDPGVVVEGLDSAELDVSSTPGVSPGSNLSFASPIYSVTAVSDLTGPAKVQLLLDYTLPPESTVFVATRRAPENPWTYVPARLMSDQQHAEFTTSHLSDFGVLVMDVEGSLQSFRDGVRARLEAGPKKTVSKPICQASSEARKDGYSVGFSRGQKLVYWCFGLENDQRVIRVINRQELPIQVDHADAPEVAPVATTPKAWKAWAGVLGDGVTFLAPGRSATFDTDLEPTQRVLISAATDSRAQSLRALRATVGALVASARSFGAPKGDPLETEAAMIARPQCAKALGRGSDAMLEACFSRRKLTATFGSRGVLISHLTTAASTRSFLRKQFAAIAADVQDDDEQNIVVRRAKPDFTAFVGTFSGEARTMLVNGEGLVFESVNNGVERVADVTYQLSEPNTENGVSTAQAVITKVKIFDRKAFKGRVPRVGDTGTFRLERGVVRSPFVNRNYCSGSAKKGTCD